MLNLLPHFLSSNGSQISDHFKRQTVQKTHTAEISIVCHAICWQSFSAARERKSQLEKREAENASHYSVNDFSSCAFGR